MCCNSPTPPTPPDPYQTANAQTQSNLQTANYNAALNRVNTYTPWGSLTYSHTPAPGSSTAGSPTFDQGGYDKAMQAWTAEQQAGGHSVDQGDGTAWVPASNMPMPQRSDFTSGGGAANAGVGQPDQWDATITLSPDQQRLLDLQNQSAIQMGQIGNQQLSRVSDMLGRPVNFDGAPSQATNVQGGPLQYGAGSGGPLRTSAGYGGIQNDVDMNGVPKLIGGDRLADDLTTQREALYRQQAAYLDPQWQNQQHDLENQLTQQGVMRNSEAWNRAMDDMNRQRTFAYNQAATSAITGGGAEQSRLFGIGLAANQNAYGQALNNAQFHNAAQGQGFAQSYQNAVLNNAAAAQQFGQNVQNAQLNNAAQGQQFGQGMQNATLQNQARQQSISEILAQRNQPLNELSALRSGSQVTAPNFPSIPGANMQGTDVAGLINQNYANQMGGYNAQMAQNNAMTKGLFGLGSAAAGAFAGSPTGAALIASMF